MSGQEYVDAAILARIPPGYEFGLQMPDLDDVQEAWDFAAAVLRVPADRLKLLPGTHVVCTYYDQPRYERAGWTAAVARGARPRPVRKG